MEYNKIKNNALYSKEVREHGDNPRNFEFFKTLNIPKDYSILDIGCNLGTFVNLLKQENWNEAWGVDIDKQCVENGKMKYPLISNKILTSKTYELPFESNSFDVITMFDVIEHINDLNTFINETKRVLKTDGYLIFGTPNQLTNAPWETINHRSLKWRKDHCSLQTLPSLKKLLFKHQFYDIIILKINIDTTYNRNKLKNKIGKIGLPLLKIIKILPLYLYPNFYGICKNKK